jgi:hypothetical protein
MKKQPSKKPKRIRPCKLIVTRGKCGVRVLLDQGRVELVFRPASPKPDLGESERLDNLLD